MRHWFTEHAGLRAPPPKAPRSAYSVYYNNEKSQWAEKHGKWSQAKDSKKVGAMWNSMNEEDKKEWYEKYDQMVEQFNINNKYWEGEANEWGKTKQAMLKESENEETDPDRRVKLKLKSDLVSADNFYYYKWW